MQPYLLTPGLTAALMLFSHNLGFAQPIAPTTPDIPCSPTPIGAQNNDTVISAPNSEGFFKLLDANQMANTSTPRGWWQSCQSGHGGPAIFRVDQSYSDGAIYSTPRGNSGGILMTNKLFASYELVFDFWIDFGQDAGIFNRTTANGRCYQTTLDYLGGASLGGAWGEGGYSGFLLQPFAFGGNESTLTIPGNNFPGYSNWTQTTQTLNPTSYGCPTTGCTQADWRRSWNMNDWNQIRIKFYAGEDTTTNVHMLSYFRRIGATPWIPITQDTTLNYATPPGFIGLNVRGAGSAGAPRGIWYKRLLWRPVNILGIPLVNGIPAPNLVEPVLPEVVDIRTTAAGKIEYDIRATSNALVGLAKFDHRIVLRDTKGRILETFTGPPGKFRYPFKTKAKGWFMVEMKTRHGTERFKVNRAVP